MDLVVLHNSKSIQKIINSLFTMCEQKSLPFPNVLAEKKIMNQVKAGMPEGSAINEFDTGDLSNSNLFFIAEMEFDGLFGYETISTSVITSYSIHYTKLYDIPSCKNRTNCFCLGSGRNNGRTIL